MSCVRALRGHVCYAAVYPRGRNSRRTGLSRPVQYAVFSTRVIALDIYWMAGLWEDHHREAWQAGAAYAYDLTASSFLFLSGCAEYYWRYSGGGEHTHTHTHGHLRTNL